MHRRTFLCSTLASPFLSTAPLWAQGTVNGSVSIQTASSTRVIAGNFEADGQAAAGGNGELRFTSTSSGPRARALLGPQALQRLSSAVTGTQFHCRYVLSGQANPGGAVWRVLQSDQHGSQTQLRIAGETYTCSASVNGGGFPGLGLAASVTLSMAAGAMLRNIPGDFMSATIGVRPAGGQNDFGLNARIEMG